MIGHQNHLKVRLGHPASNRKSPIRRTIVFTLLVAISFIVLSGYYLIYSWNRYNSIASQEAIVLAESMSALLHKEHIAALTGRSEDILKEEYILLKNNLLQMIQVTNPIRFAYFMGMLDGKVIILVDSESPDTSTYSPPGQVYEEADEIFFNTFRSGEPALTRPVTDRWGTWISALVPIKYAQSSQVIAIFGIDYSASEWKARLIRQMVPDLIIVVCLLFLLIALIITNIQKSALRRLSRKLAYDEALYHHIFMQAPIGIALVQGKRFVLESEYGHANINPMFERITGRASEELVNLSWTELTYPEDLPANLELYSQFVAGEIDGYTMEKRYVKPDGSLVWANLRVCRLAGFPDGQAMHLSLLEDITARKEAEQKLRDSERSKSVLLSNLPGMAYRCAYDREWTMEYVSDGCLDLTGYPAESLIQNRDLSFSQLITRNYQEPLWSEWEKMLALKLPFRSEYEIMTMNGDQKWVLELGEGIFNQAGEVEALEGIILDISDRKKAEDQLRFVGEHDPWTGLFNRRYLEICLRKDNEISGTGRRAVISINLNTMYLLSLTYGFSYSQIVLKAIADALSAFCNEDRQLFSSYEYRFVFYVKRYKDVGELRTLCEEIVKAISPITSSERISGGIGVLEIDQERDFDVDLLLKNLLRTSERAMQTENAELGIAFFNEVMAKQIEREDSITRELIEIAEGINPERLFLQFQPVLDINQNEICMFEALARLNSEHFGRVPPNEFIPLAERTKLIYKLGDRIIDQSLQFLKQLEKRGHQRIGIAINISALQLLKSGFARCLIDAVSQSKVNPSSIGIELTESIFSSNYDEINRVIGELRAVGMKISIDDFGTGYSSLAREREINADCLKIDKHFIDKLMVLHHGETITSDIISMGHKLGHTVVAEGVEHESQLEYLREHDCDMIQGYLISRPLDADAALNFPEKWRSSCKPA